MKNFTISKTKILVALAGLMTIWIVYAIFSAPTLEELNVAIGEMNYWKELHTIEIERLEKKLEQDKKPHIAKIKEFDEKARTIQKQIDDITNSLLLKKNNDKLTLLFPDSGNPRSPLGLFAPTPVVAAGIPPSVPPTVEGNEKIHRGDREDASGTRKIAHYYPANITDEAVKARIKYVHRLIWEAGLYQYEKQIIQQIMLESGFNPLALNLRGGEASIGLTQLNLVGKYGMKYSDAAYIVRVLTGRTKVNDAEFNRVKNIKTPNGTPVWKFMTIEFQVQPLFEKYKDGVAKGWSEKRIIASHNCPACAVYNSYSPAVRGYISIVSNVAVIQI